MCLYMSSIIVLIYQHDKWFQLYLCEWGSLQGARDANCHDNISLHSFERKMCQVLNQSCRNRCKIQSLGTYLLSMDIFIFFLNILCIYSISDVQDSV